MDHLDEVPGAAVANVGDAGAIVDLGRCRRPGRQPPGTDAASALGELVSLVATIDNGITGLEEVGEGRDDLVNGRAGLEEEDELAG